jgi:hypothetical protein
MDARIGTTDLEARSRGHRLGKNVIAVGIVDHEQVLVSAAGWYQEGRHGVGGDATPELNAGQSDGGQLVAAVTADDE